MNFKLAPLSNLLSAINFATIKHTNQKRKYTGEPYVSHCISVAKILVDSGCEEPCIIAAILHDTIEDTQTTYEELENNFGTVIAQLVRELTDPPLSAGNRATRKQITRERLRSASWYAKTIKYADLIHNIESITEHDHKFARTFLDEVIDTMPILEGGDKLLYARLTEVILQAERDLAQFAIKIFQ